MYIVFLYLLEDMEWQCGTVWTRCDWNWSCLV